MSLPSTLHRWQLPRFGTEHLEQAAVPLAPPGPGQVLVRVQAAALNYRDLLIARDGMGAAPAFPFVPVSDLAGTVAAVGDGVRSAAVGDRVIGSFWQGWHDAERPSDSTPLGLPGPGALATYVTLAAADLVPAPATLDAVRAATLPCAGLTAWMALVEQGRLHAGQTVLVHGTGGVALFGLQIARIHGAVPVVVTGDAAKHDRAKALGAAQVLARDGDWPAQVRALTGGRGADQVLETAGGANLGRSLEALRPGGRVSVIGALAGDTVSSSVYTLLMKRAVVQGIGVGPTRALGDLVRAVDATGLQPAVAATYGWNEVPQAFGHLARGAFGKVVVRVAD